MSERLSLREYQRKLSARLVNLEARHAASKLGVQIGKAGWLVELADAGEVIPVPPIASVPLTHTWFAGVANIRGNLYSVVDFAAFLGAAPAQPTEQSRLLLIHGKYRVSAALLVDRVLGMHGSERLQHKRDADKMAPWVKAEYTDSSGKAWHELDVPQLVQHADFLNVGI